MEVLRGPVFDYMIEIVESQRVETEVMRIKIKVKKASERGKDGLRNKFLCRSQDLTISQ